MSFKKDLTPIHEGDSSVLAVGWLAPKQFFNVGKSSKQFLDNLLQHVKYSAIQTMGRHLCEMCMEKREHSVKILLKNKNSIHLGSSEILVFSANGTIFNAQNLIYHYVIDCGYLPPVEFVEAVLSSPLPPSKEYIDLLSVRSGKWLACPLVDMITGEVIWIPSTFFSDIEKK